MDLSQNGLGTTAALALGEPAHLPGLLALRLVDNPMITEPAGTGLIASSQGQRLAFVELDNLPLS